MQIEKHPPQFIERNVNKFSLKGKDTTACIEWFGKKEKKTAWTMESEIQKSTWTIPASMTWKTRRFFRSKTISAYLQISTRLGKGSNSLTVQYFPKKWTWSISTLNRKAPFWHFPIVIFIICRPRVLSSCIYILWWCKSWTWPSGKSRILSYHLSNNIFPMVTMVGTIHHLVLENKTSFRIRKRARNEYLSWAIRENMLRTLMDNWKVQVTLFW